MHKEPQSENDLLLQKTIHDRLHDDPKTDASKMEVEVRDGDVILKGGADTEEEKIHAGQIAASVPGVKKVENHLHIDIGVAHALSAFVARIISGDEDKKTDPEEKTEPE